MIRSLIKQVVFAFQFTLLLMVLLLAPKAFAQSFEEVAVGASHICALDNSGQVECTTTPIATRLLPPADLPLMAELAAGQQHTCGITLDGAVECWGSDAFGVLQVPSFDVPVASITAGFNHACALDVDGQAECWGLNTNGQLNVPDVEGGFVLLDAARNATCGIDAIGDIHCWSTDAFFNPGVPIAGPFIDLDLDANQACGLTANGEIECWASRERNNLSPPTNGPYTDMTVTNSAICGLRVDQFLDCSFAEPTIFDLDVRSEEYPLDTRLSSIERSNLQFGGVPICGIRADNGTISCFGGSDFDGSLPAPPGAGDTATAFNASNITLGLAARIYGRNQVELFWNRVPTAFPIIFVEVYRDDELLVTTQNKIILSAARKAATVSVQWMTQVTQEDFPTQLSSTGIHWKWSTPVILLQMKIPGQRTLRESRI